MNIVQNFSLKVFFQVLVTFKSNFEGFSVILIGN